MKEPIEREYKVLLTKKQFDLYLHSYNFPIVVYQKNMYFDTGDSYIKKLGGALRLRWKDGKTIFTLKLKNDETSKIELEKVLDPHLAERYWEDPEIASWLKKSGINWEFLIPIYEVHTIRHIFELQEAELCLDENNFGYITDYELELEMKENESGIQVINQILEKIGFKFQKNCPSKIARAAVYSKLFAKH